MLARLTFGIATALGITASQAQTPLKPWQWDEATPLERKAYSCSAMLLILTADNSTPEFKRLGQMATAGGMILGPVGGSETSKRLAVRATNGYVFAVRDSEIKVLSALWLADQAKFKAQAWECFSWSIAISEDVHSGKLKNPSQVTYPTNLPTVGSKPDDFETWVTASVTAWNAMGHVTPSDAKELLRRGL